MKKLSLLMIYSLVLASCGSGGSSSDDAKKLSENLTDSAIQLKNASYSSEQEKIFYSRFLTGTDFCDKYKSIISLEQGFRVSVPVDYQKPEGEKTSIYAFFTGGVYNPNLPTLIFFDGGSGGNSHTATKFVTGYNELHYDQRGIGCSRPEKFELYRSPDFYSSENNAKDAKAIIDNLKIDKISVYGGSYGTVPATIFASLYPEASTALVLEGVIFDTQTADQSKLIHFNLKKMYASLPEPTKEAMLSYFNTSDKAFSIYSFSRLFLYSNDGFNVLKNFLLSVFKSPTAINKNLADKYFDPDFNQQTFFEQDSITNVDYVNNRMINCKESPRGNIYASVFYTEKAELTGVVTKHEFEPYLYDSSKDTFCDSVNIPQNKVTYSADQYKVTVPVTYFQGTWDGATQAPDSIKHWKKVPKGKAQLLLAVHGGHSANFEALTADSDKGQSVVFKKALQGELILPEEVNTLNKLQSPIKWVMTSRGF